MYLLLLFRGRKDIPVFHITIGSKLVRYLSWFPSTFYFHVKDTDSQISTWQRLHQDAEKETCSDEFAVSAENIHLF